MNHDYFSDQAGNYESKQSHLYFQIDFHISKLSYDLKKIKLNSKYIAINMSS